MIRFNCDYSEGAHPSILARLQETNLVQTPGYGNDVYCQQAADLIRQACGDNTLDVHFLVGGTQTNLTVIAGCLRPFQGVIAPDTGHISLHETGAIEATGHKVITLPGTDGKIHPRQISAYCDAHRAEEMPEYMVQPKMVYISYPTEYGTLYTKQELQALRDVCDKYGLYLFMDGARLGYGLCAPTADVTLPEIAQFCDVFYIGGTKIGALMGEAVVIRRQELKQDFRYMMKQTGALLAKGRILGIQFLELFSNNLYFKLSKHADTAAAVIKAALLEAGAELLYNSDTNQLFCTLPDGMAQELEKNYIFAHFGKTPQGKTITRICTSWATHMEDAKQLAADIVRFAKPDGK